MNADFERRVCPLQSLQDHGASALATRARGGPIKLAHLIEKQANTYGEDIQNA